MRHTGIRSSRHSRRAAIAGGALGLIALGVARPAVAQAVASATAPLGACAPAGLLRQPRLRAASGDSLAASASRRLIEMRQAITAGADAQAGGGRPGMRIALTRGWLGLSTAEITERRLGPDGMRVRYCDYPVIVSVRGGSPAQRAGLEVGDTIVAYNDIELRSGSEFAFDRLFVPDSTVRVSVRREGRPLTLPLVVGRLPSDVAVTQVFQSSGGTGYGFVLVNPPDQGSVVAVPRPGPDVPSASGARARSSTRPARRDVGAPPLPGTMPTTPFVFGLGFNGPSAIAGAQLMAMDDDLRQAVGAKRGVLVLRVAEGSPASEAGLRAGDVIVTADGNAVTSPLVVQRAILQSREDHAVPLRVERRGKSREVTLRW